MINGSAVLLRSIQAVAALVQFFSSVSHYCDNVTHPLNQNADTGSSTEQYEYEFDDVDDNTQSPVSANSNTTASATVLPASASASCDVCLDAPYYCVDMQRFVSNVLTHSSKTILTVLYVAV